jgi:hypothetical protein
VLDLADLHLLLRTIHIGAGALGLMAFWAAVFTKKGSATHIRYGLVFVSCALPGRRLLSRLVWLGSRRFVQLWYDPRHV